MNRDPSNKQLDDQGGGNHSPQASPVYVVPPQNAIHSAEANEVSLLELWDIIWQRRTFIALLTLAFLVSSVGYVLLATPWYKADVLLAPADEKSTQGIAGELGGLASLAGLAGISVGGGGNVEPIAVLRSRDFARAFIREYDLLPVFFADEWDADAGAWKSKDPFDWPDMRDAIEYFDENIRRVSEDPQTSLVTFSIEWTDPEVAAEWANVLVTRLNLYMRQRALAEAETNVRYLQEEMAATNVVSLRQSISSLLEVEMQKLMLAKGSEEFAFRIIDTAQIPKDSERPRHLVIISIAVIMGAMISVFVVLVSHVIANARIREQSGAEATDLS